MSRGNKGFLSGLALLGLSLLLLGDPAGAQLVTGGPAAGEDNLAPEPVSEVTADTITAAGAQAIEVTWTLSPSDFVRPQPVGSDVTSGGTAVYVNDVAEYRVARITSAPADTLVLGSVAAGETSFVDTALAGLTGALRYTVTALDAAGNESAPVASAEISLAPPGEAEVEVPGEPLELRGLIKFDNFCGGEPCGVYRIPFINGLAELLDIAPSRIRVISITEGSVVVVYEILPDPSDPVTGDPAAAIAQINQMLASNPAAFTAIDPDLGSVTQAGIAQGTAIDFGTVEPDATASETITIANTSTDPQSILAGTVEVSGAGFSGSPASFSAAQGQSATIQLSFSAADVDNLNGTYAGLATITTNDPANPQIVVSLAAAIVNGVEPAELRIAPAALNFGTTVVDSVETMILNLSNRGGVTLTGSIALTGDAVFGISETSFSLAADEDLEVEVTFSPTDTVAYTGTITITSDDPVQPEAVLPVQGTGVAAGFVPALTGDFDGDNDVDFDDFFQFADHFGLSSGDAGWDPLFDLAPEGAPDGTVNFDDFFVFADHFGESL
ncbi:MAG: choice-of-anchor D domain-containing protein [Candidatus Latescibacterota bacterium]